MGELYSKATCDRKRKEVKELQKELDKKIKLRDAWHKEAEEFEEALAEKEEETGNLSEEEAAARIDEIENDLLPAASQRLDDSIEAYKDAVATKEQTEREIERAEDSILALDDQIQSLIADREQALSDYVENNDSPDANELQGIYDGYQAAIDEVIRQIDAVIENDLLPLEQTLVENDQAVSDAVKEMTAATDEAKDLREELNNLKSADKIRDDYNSASRAANSYQDHVIRLKKQISDLEAEIRQKCEGEGEDEDFDDEEEYEDEEDDFEEDDWEEEDYDYEEEEDFEDGEDEDYEEDDDYRN